MLGNKKFILNFNRYRNTHFRVLNTAKVEYTKLVTKVLEDGDYFPRLLTGQYILSYKYFPRTKAVTDVANPLSVVDKFTQDALVQNGVFIDDNHNYIKGVFYGFGGIDRVNPRAELRIYKLSCG